MYTALTDKQFVSFIERQRPLQDLRERVPDQGTLLRSYADFLQRRFSPDRCTEACTCCGARGDQVRKFTWRAIFHTRSNIISTAIGLLLAMGGHGWTKCSYMAATTYHTFCSRCGFKVWLRQAASEIVDKLCFVLLLCGGGIIGGFGVFAFVLMFSNPNAREIMRLGAGLFLGSIAIWLGIIGKKAARRLPMPKQIQNFIQSPFDLRRSVRT